MKQCSLLCILALLFALSTTGTAQFKDIGIGGGIGFGAVFGQTDDLSDRDSRFLARAFMRFGFTSSVQGELGVGLGRLVGTNRVGNYEGDQSGSSAVTQLVPIDVRILISPFSFNNWNPYLYGGAGVIHYDMEEIPTNRDLSVKTKGWVGYAPAGVGVQIRLDDYSALEFSGGFNYAFNDNLNTITASSQAQATGKDAYWNFLAGLTVVTESGSADPDGDGLTNRQEKELGTDRKNRDTDGDGLSDGDEVMVHKTNPLVADTDGDGLNDGQEVNQYKTDPLKADTDGDGLNDGAEVNVHRTDPLKADTDGGTVDDGKEVANRTNPLDPTDDIPKPMIKVEVGKAIVLEGIVFKTGKWDIESASEEILEQAFNTLDQNKDVVVEIRGYTDNVGNPRSNMRLSQRRADAVKTWLVNKGIAADRITAKGYGDKNPIGDNKTADGRQKNRRIEFFRVK